MNIKTKLLIHDIQKSVAKRGLQAKGEVQQYIDSEVLRLSDPYIPKDTGKLKQSGTRSTSIGSGKVVWNTPYARKQYYTNRGNGLRGKLWFERMKANSRDDILRGAAKIAGGKGKKK